ncbi:MAG: hypothetical protein MZV70_28910 [Desulfobacterales bacterium]|nr:hypothetical protein [Desulfobacterales bacterium]
MPKKTAWCVVNADRRHAGPGRALPQGGAAVCKHHPPQKRPHHPGLHRVQRPPARTRPTPRFTIEARGPGQPGGFTERRLQHLHADRFYRPDGELGP